MLEYNVIQENIKNRRTVRNYSRREVQESDIIELIEVARWAPSAHNAQPWHFVYVKDYDRREHLVNSMALELAKDMEADGIALPIQVQRINRSKQLFLSSSALILAGITMSDMDVYLDIKRQKHEETMAAQSLGAAIQTFLITANAKGLATGWFCAPLFSQDLVRNILELPENFHPQAFITLGYYESPSTAPQRKELKEIFTIR